MPDEFYGFELRRIGIPREGSLFINYDCSDKSIVWTDLLDKLEAIMKEYVVRFSNVSSITMSQPYGNTRKLEDIRDFEPIPMDYTAFFKQFDVKKLARPYFKAYADKDEGHVLRGEELRVDYAEQLFILRHMLPVRSQVHKPEQLYNRIEQKLQ